MSQCFIHCNYRKTIYKETFKSLMTIHVYITIPLRIYIYNQHVCICLLMDNLITIPMFSERTLSSQSMI